MRLRHGYLAVLLIALTATGLSSALQAQPSQAERPPASPDSSTRMSYAPDMWLPPELGNLPPAVPSPPRHLTPAERAALPPPETMVYHQLPPTDGTLDALLRVKPGQWRDMLSTVHGTDDRTQITTTTSIPWRWIGKIYITFSHGSYVGSAYLISDNVCLTAGHCVYDSADTDGWANSIYFIPAMNGIEQWNGYRQYKPYNHAIANGLATWTGWTGSADPNHDLGVIFLDRNIGDYIGHFSYRSSTVSWLDGQIVNVSGYPGDKPTGTQWYDYNNCLNVTDYKIYYDIDTYGGNSGCPCWTLVSGTRWAEGSHAYGGGTYNSATKISPDKKTNIDTWVTGHTATDKPDLVDDGRTWAGFTPAAVTPGDNWKAWCDIRNIGTANITGGITVEFRLSTNTTITTSDYLIDTVTVTGLNRFSYKSANMAYVPFPYSVPPGNYYVGWIIDRPSTYNEFNETNNTEYLTTPVTVTRGHAIEWTGETGYTSDGVDPGSGDPNSTDFTFRVRFFDNSNANPLVRKVLIAKKSCKPWKLHKNPDMSLASGTPKTGAIYTYTTKLPNKVYKYRFRFQATDGAWVTGPADPYQQGPLITGPPILCWSGKPGFTSDGVHPDSAPRKSKFKFQVMYQDSAGSGPQIGEVVVRRNGKGYKAKSMASYGGSYRLGRMYTTTLWIYHTGSFDYRFRFNDGIGYASGPPANWTPGPAITSSAMQLTGLAAVPTRAGAQLTFTLSAAADVSATVLNVAGRPIRTVVTDKPLDSGTQTLVWNGQADDGLSVPAGLYMVRVTARDADGGQSTAMATVALR